MFRCSFNTLLEKDNSVSIHAKNLQTLMIEMFKTKVNINPPFMKEIFCERTVTYNLRNNNEFLLPRVRTTSYGSETIKYIGQRLWLSVPQHIRDAQSINEFKKQIRSWNGADCTCRLCRTFIPRISDFKLLGFLLYYALTLFCNFIPCILYLIYLIMYIYLLDVLILAVGLD